MYEQIAQIILALTSIKGPHILQLIISCITIWTMLLAGDKHPHAWLVGLGNQALWATVIWWTEAWGFVPLCIAMCYVYARNHFKWNEKKPVHNPAPVVVVGDSVSDFPPEGELNVIYRAKKEGRLYFYDGQRYRAWE